MENRTGVLFIRRMPDNTKDAFKAWCAKHRVNMTEAIIELMRLTALGEVLTPRHIMIMRKNKKKRALLKR